MQRRVFFSVVILMAIGIVMSYSLSAYANIIYGSRETLFLEKQFYVTMASVLVIWILSQCDIDKILKPMGWSILICSTILLFVLPALPEGLASSAGGAKRWIRLGFISLGPVEFFKIGFIFFLSWSFSRKFFGEDQTSDWTWFKLMPHLCLLGVFAICSIGLQNDLGQVVLLGLIMCVMSLLAGGGFRVLGVPVLSVLLIGAFAILTNETRILRVLNWWLAGPQEFIYACLSFVSSWIGWDFQSGNEVMEIAEPYQIYHAGNAIFNGGFWGQGTGEGVLKLGFLSEVHTDMVLAGLAEEWGFVGVLIVLGIFFVGVFYPILWIANRADNNIHFLFCIGIASALCASILFNAFGVLGIIPLKGIAVPFLSYGGSSMLANSIAVGLVLSIARKNIVK